MHIKVNVKSFFWISDDVSGSGVYVVLEEGNRQGFLLLQAPFGSDMSFIPSEIQGFGKVK
ncbi:MAG: hypothetical protein R2805_06395 [Flavobacterium sp.]|uniref:hypothetical protein n=1 Tax=Flavobacterium sp. TaxID=239 RepID=UPI0035280329